MNRDWLRCAVSILVFAALGQTPPPAAAQAAPVAQVTYQDNFSNPNSGWPQQSGDPLGARLGYGTGEYFLTKLAGSGGAVSAGRRLDPITQPEIEIDARLMPPTENAFVFLLVRFDDTDAIYRFDVHPRASSFRLTRSVADEITPLIPRTHASAIQADAATNRLGIRIRDGEVVVRVNGQDVGRVLAPSEPAGRYGIGVGHMLDGQAEARFSNLVVTGTVRQAPPAVATGGAGR
jgi:hypothetical protein